MKQPAQPEQKGGWLEKYRPTKVKDVLGDEYKIGLIQTFIRDFDKATVPNLIVTGPNGIGKSLIVDLALAENKFEKVTIDLMNMAVPRKKKDREKENEDTVATGSNRSVKTYYSIIENNKKHTDSGKIALVFDDVSNISNLKEKEAIKSLIKYNNKYKAFPIIIIANNKHSKIVNEIKKMLSYSSKKKKSESDSEADDDADAETGLDEPEEEKGQKKSKKINEVILRPPSFNQLEGYIKKICKDENLVLLHKKSDSEDIVENIITHCQNDVRRLINIMEELKLIYGSKKITEEMFEKYKETSKKKDTDPGIYETTRYLLNSYTGIENALLLYGEDRATIPLMVHENYTLNLRTQYPDMDKKSQIDIIRNISQSISISDRIDGLIYSNQYWNLQDVHGFYACAIPSYYVNKTPDKLNTLEKYAYTQDYNKTSIMKIKNKVIREVKKNPFLRSISIYDILYFSSILHHLFQKDSEGKIPKKNYDTIIDLLKPYGLTLKKIEAIIKIDKTVMEKQVITGKKRNILKEQLGVSE